MADHHRRPDRHTFLLRLLGAVVALWALLTLVGLLITRALDDAAPFADEGAVNRSLAEGRTPTGERVSGWFSHLASTPVIIGMLLLTVLIFRKVYGRWRESAFLFFAVWTQSLVFLATAQLIGRNRPDVRQQLDSAPPTGSFPSGHTGAAVALFVGIALVVGWHTRRTWIRVVVGLLAVGLPVMVAYSRLYRGMHFPSDVAAAVVNGLLAVFIWARGLLFAVLPERWGRALDGTAAAGHDRYDPAAGVRA